MKKMKQPQENDKKRWIENFAAWMDARNLTNDTKTHYLYCAKHFLNSCSSFPPTKDDVVNFISSKKGKRVVYWSVIKRLFKVNGYSVMSEHDMEMYKPKLSEHPPNRPYFETVEQVFQFLDGARTDWLKLAILIAAETGARRKQITLMMRDDFNPEERTLRIPPVKRGVERFEVLSARTAKLLKDYLESRKDDDPHLIVNSRGKPLTVMLMTIAFINLKKRLGIYLKGLSWHSFRRSYATWLYQHGLKELEIMQAGGWKSLNMVAAYTRLKPSETILKAAKIHPMKKERWS